MILMCFRDAKLVTTEQPGFSGEYILKCSAAVFHLEHMASVSVMSMANQWQEQRFRFLSLRLSHCRLFPSHLALTQHNISDSFQASIIIENKNLIHFYLKTHLGVTSSGKAFTHHTSTYHPFFVISQRLLLAPVDSLNRNCSASCKRNTSFFP